MIECIKVKRQSMYATINEKHIYIYLNFTYLFFETVNRKKMYNITGIKTIKIVIG